MAPCCHYASLYLSDDYSYAQARYCAREESCLSKGFFYTNKIQSVNKALASFFR